MRLQRKKKEQWVTKQMAAISLVSSRAILSDTCEWEQLCCCYQHPIWCCLSLWIYVVILVSRKRKFFFVYFVIVSNSGLYFLSLNVLPLYKLFKSITRSQFLLLWSNFVPNFIITCLRWKHGACIRFPISRLEAATGCLSFFLDCSILKVKKFPKMRFRSWFSCLHMWFQCYLNNPMVSGLVSSYSVEGPGFPPLLYHVCELHFRI